MAGFLSSWSGRNSAPAQLKLKAWCYPGWQATRQHSIEARSLLLQSSCNVLQRSCSSSTLQSCNSLTNYRYLYLYQWIPDDTQFFFYYSGIRLLFNQSDDVLPSSLFDPVTLAGFCLCTAQSMYLLPCSNLIAVTSGHDLGHHFCR